MLPEQVPDHVLAEAVVRIRVGALALGWLLEEGLGSLVAEVGHAAAVLVVAVAGTFAGWVEAPDLLA